MRRTLVLLAVLLAGSWEDRAAAPPTPAPELHELTDAAESTPLAFLRAGHSLHLVVWQDAPDSAPRGFSRRPSSHRGGTGLHSAGTRAACATHALHHLEHTARLALLRAGHCAFHTATPPPFRSV